MYKFRNSALEVEALTHRSFGRPDNQRLECFGDTVVNLVLTEALFFEHRDWQEDRLSQAKGQLIKAETLAWAALELGLDRRVRLGGFVRVSTKVLCDLFEAYVGAVFLDGGLGEARRVVIGVLGGRVVVVSPYEENFKARLQHVLQARGQFPLYEVVGVDGPGHARVWEVRVVVRDKSGRPVRSLGCGSGSSKQLAEMVAAEKSLREV